MSWIYGKKLDYKDKNISTYKQKDGTLSDAGYMNWYGPALQTELTAKYGEVASEKINELPQYDPANVEALADSPLKGEKDHLLRFFGYFWKQQ